ncbi:CubicO group peptidase, beta-lactamase class C family [Sinosporangium album]|uniref:CubicO group peptidase, beta-lactamase class C family n=2 Tax=Sinosporangium album TaxID=504805 RepID=A0A1G7SA93_9ACTN|nr:CubicO group peptidase, beta-lactamase class C family [Sinosporangium album]
MGSSGSIGSIVKDVCAPYIKPDGPGFAIAVIRDGEVVFAEGYGLASLEFGVPITPETRFDIASTSKQFTAAGIALLEQDGKLSAGDDIRDYMPELARHYPKITVGQLVHHTSGVRDYIALAGMAGRYIENLSPEDEVVELLARQRGLDFEPGSRFSYSNSGYLLMARLVRLVSGVTFREFLHARIFGPLGMDSTFARDDYREVVHRRATGYTPGPDGGMVVDNPWIDVVGDGAVQTTVGDLALWDRQFYGSTLPDGDDLIRRLLVRGRLNDGTELGYAYGLMLDERGGRRTVHHGGSWGGFRSQFLRFPDDRLTVIVLANCPSTDPNAVAHGVAERVLGLSGPGSGGAGGRAERPEAPDLADKVGWYRDAEGTTFLELLVSDEGPGVRLLGDVLPLEPAGSPKDGQQRFGIGGFGLDAALTVRADGSLHVEVHHMLDATLRQVEGSAVPDPGLAGTYYSDELDAVYRITVDERGVRLRRGWREPEELTPTGEGFYVSGLLVLEHSGPDITVKDPRAVGLRFTRRD